MAPRTPVSSSIAPTGRRSPREAALIADVLEALSGQLKAAETMSETERAALATPDEVGELISAAVSEINRLSPGLRGGVAPVLGSGVLQSLIRQRHTDAAKATVTPGESVDERR